MELACDVRPDVCRLLRPQLVVGFILLDLPWYEGSLGWTGSGHGSQLGRLLRPDAVFPADAMLAEERHSCILCTVDLVMIGVQLRKMRS